MGPLTVWGEGRGFRVVWLLEELGLAYRLRDVDLRPGADSDPAFLAVNPGGFIPALQDGETIIVESIAIMEYLEPKSVFINAKPAIANPFTLQ